MNARNLRPDRGADAVSATVDLFYTKVLDDPRLARMASAPRWRHSA
jgi:truncated hemoglobin YjbI